MSLLEQDTTRKGRVDKNVTEFKAGNDEEYEVKGIRDSAVYAKKSVAGQIPNLYYMISWKSYPKEKNTWEPASAVQHLRKLLSTFHKNNPNEPMATSLSVNTTSPIAWPRSKPTKATKRKHGWLATSTRNKKAKTS